MALEQKLLESPLPTPDIIALCGHKDYGEYANDIIIRTAQKCKDAGEYPDYLIYGNSTYAKHRRKHNLLVGNAPAIVYTYVNILRSDTQRAMFIGNKDTGKIIARCNEYFKPSKEMLFVDEKKSLAENVLAGKNALYGAQNPLTHTLILNADLPFLSHINPILHDEDRRLYDFVLDCNSRELQGDLLPRSYRVRIEYKRASEEKSRLFWIKEQNYFLVNLSHVDEKNISSINSAYDGRRIHDAGGKGSKDLFRETFLRKGRFLRSLAIAAPKYFVHNLAVKMKLIDRPFLVTSRQAERLLNMGARVHGIDIRSKIKVETCDPSAKKDMDSFGDWSYLNAMYYMSGRGFKHIYPHADEVEAFAQDMMSRLAKEIPIFENFPAYMNAEFHTFGLLPPYDNCGNFHSTLIGDQFVWDDIQLHTRYMQEQHRKELREHSHTLAI